MAIKAIERGNLSQRQAAKIFKVPRTTIQERVFGKRSNKLGRPPVLSETEETLIAERVKVSYIENVTKAPVEKLK